MLTAAICCAVSAARDASGPDWLAPATGMAHADMIWLLNAANAAEDRPGAALQDVPAGEGRWQGGGAPQQAPLLHVTRLL